MKFRPYRWQDAAVEHAVAALSAPGRQLYAAPTGCGKSVVELLVQAAYDDCWIVSPRDEIIAGMMDKLNAAPDEDSWDRRISTPIRLRNALLRGDLQPPGRLIYDEGHHHNAETWQQLDLLTGMSPTVAYTATPYRGTPKGTRELRERWGDPLWLITYDEAVAEGYISRPTFQVLPLVDDDVVEVRGGEFEVTSLESATVDRLGDAAEHARRWYSDLWDVPTVFAMPSSSSCVRLREELARRGAPSAVVAASTPRAEREAAFAATAARIVALLHINIVSEGVDLPLRRLVDMAPTLSPVKWVQQLGRITRPSPRPPEYVCTNRNLVRHAYALEGFVPTASVVEHERAFPDAKRPHTRVLGLEAIGRFKPSSAKLLSGARLYSYALRVVVANAVVEYAAIVPPVGDPVWACRADSVVDGKRQYGRWRRCDAPSDLRGFASTGAKEPSEKQLAWWRRSAARYGLDPDQDVDRRAFQALPVLADLGARM